MPRQAWPMSSLSCRWLHITKVSWLKRNKWISVQSIFKSIFSDVSGAEANFSPDGAPHSKATTYQINDLERWIVEPSCQAADTPKPRYLSKHTAGLLDRCLALYWLGILLPKTHPNAQPRLSWGGKEILLVIQYTTLIRSEIVEMEHTFGLREYLIAKFFASLNR